MKNDNIITDELIAKYINGRTSKQEDELILDFMSKNDEYVNELFDTAIAVRLQQKQWEKENASHIVRIPLYQTWIFKVAASMVVLIITTWFILQKNHNNQSQQFVLNEQREEMTLVTNPIDSKSNALLAYGEEDNIKTTERTVYSIMASQIEQTVLSPSKDISLKQRVLSVQIPSECDFNQELSIEWECNTELTLEFSCDEGQTWILQNTITDDIHSISTDELLYLYSLNQEGFRWRMTAHYCDRNDVQEGKVSFHTK